MTITRRQILAGAATTAAVAAMPAAVIAEQGFDLAAEKRWASLSPSIYRTLSLPFWCRLRGHPYPTKTGKIGRLVPGVWSEQIEYVDQPVCSGCWEKI
jgi:hypothetical protein